MSALPSRRYNFDLVLSISIFLFANEVDLTSLFSSFDPSVFFSHFAFALPFSSACESSFSSHSSFILHLALLLDFLPPFLCFEPGQIYCLVIFVLVFATYLLGFWSLTFSKLSWALWCVAAYQLHASRTAYFPRCSSLLVRAFIGWTAVSLLTNLACLVK